MREGKGRRGKEKVVEASPKFLVEEREKETGRRARGRRQGKRRRERGKGGSEVAAPLWPI